MSSEQTGKKKVPRSNEDILAVEDRLQRLQGVFRDIRNGMRENDMATVDLAMGTFEHLISMLEPLAEKYYGEYRSQLATLTAKRAQDKMRGDREKRIRK